MEHCLDAPEQSEYLGKEKLEIQDQLKIIHSLMATLDYIWKSWTLTLSCTCWTWMSITPEATVLSSRASGPLHWFSMFHPARFTSKPRLVAPQIVWSRQGRTKMAEYQFRVAKWVENYQKEEKIEMKLPIMQFPWQLPFTYSFNPLFQAAIPGSAGNHTTAAHILFLTHLLIKIIIPYIEIALNGSGWRFWIAWGRQFLPVLDACWNNTCGWKP